MGKPWGLKDMRERLAAFTSHFTKGNTPMIDFKKPPARGAYEFLTRPRLEPEVRSPAPPPTPPTPWGGPGRIHVQIEITNGRTPAPRSRYSVLAWVVWAIVALILIGALAGCAGTVDGIKRATGNADIANWELDNQEARQAAPGTLEKCEKRNDAGTCLSRAKSQNQVAVEMAENDRKVAAEEAATARYNASPEHQAYVHAVQAAQSDCAMQLWGRNDAFAMYATRVDIRDGRCVPIRDHRAWPLDWPSW
jgi:hypothetical protein